MKKTNRNRPSFEIEKSLWLKGYSLVCGIDEAGRGALGGPLVSSAVILPKNLKINGINDSKLLSATQREFLFEEIIAQAIGYSISMASVDEINKLGIQGATYLSYKRSIDGLKKEPDHLLIDFYKLPDSTINQTSIKFGDKISCSIAAASILAKVTRDKIMRELAEDPKLNVYGFEKHFGYGTKLHLQKLAEYGVSKAHRLSYAPCRRIVGS